MSGDDLRTTTEWLVEFDVAIVDPDGWRGPGGVGYDVPIDRDEFLRRLSMSTVDYGRRARNA